MQRVAEFYRDVFGLVELARHYQLDGQLRSVWLDLVGGILMVEHSEEPVRRVTGVGAGPFLLAFRVDPAQRAALEAVLASKGHAIEARTDHSSYARDPEGNRVAISHYPLGGAPIASG